MYKRKTVDFCGKRCKVLKRYRISEEYAMENELYFLDRIRFVDKNGMVHDCADTFGRGAK